MTLYLLIALSIILALTFLVLLSGAAGTVKLQMIDNDWAKALGHVAAAAIIALAAVALVDRLPL